MSQDFESSNWYRVAAVKPRLAPELSAQRQVVRGAVWYVLFDPLNQRTHRLTPEAWFLVARMDGSQSVAQLWQAAVQALGQQAPPQDEVIQLLSQLHDADALASDTLPDLGELLRRRDKQRRMRWQRNLLNPMSLRFRLWDPDAFLQRTLPAVAWLLGPLGLLLWLALVAPAAVLALIHWDEIGGNASDRLLSAANLMTMLVVYPGVKLLHELSHGWVARRFGAEVHDMGLMFLLLMPVPYVDASASSAFSRKGQRALVAAAGMLSELLLAALALWVWLAVEPGVVRSLAFSVMALCGLSTLLFNGNPLLRFDGYYVLCDLTEVPNLGQRSNRLWLWLIKRFALGLDQARAPEMVAGERKWLFAYAPLALAYRLFITIGIALFLATEYLYLGLALGVWGIVTQFVWPLLKGAHWLWAGPELVGRRARPALATAALAATGALLLALPVPMSTYAQGVVWPGDSAQLRADESGFVGALRVRSGMPAQAGALMATLGNDDVEREHAAAAARVEQEFARYRVALAATRDGGDSGQARVEAEVRASALRQAERELAHAAARHGGLRVAAHRSGTAVLPMAEDLPGRWLRKGDSIGYVLTGEAPTVRVVVTQDDIAAVRGALARIEVRLAGDLSLRYQARLVREVPGGDSTLPSLALSLEQGGTVAVAAGADDQPRTLNRVFQFDLQLPPEALGALVGERAHVRFVHADQALGMQGWRRLRQVLLSRLTL